MKYLGRIALCSAFAVLLSGCGKKSGRVGGEAAGEMKSVVPSPQMATHLGFAARVPGDADVFVAGYHADAHIKRIAESMMDDLKPTDEKQKEFEEILKRLGGEQFLFVGGGAGRQLGQLMTSYQQFSASFSGYLAGAMLDSARDGKFTPEAPDLKEWFPEDMMNDWLDAMVSDKRFNVPSVVIGWHPDASEEAQCLEMCRGFVSEQFKDVKEAETVEFEAHGGRFSGYVMKGDVVFQELLDQTEEAMEKNHAERLEAMAAIGEERVASLLAAMERFEFTVASGVVDGRVMLYVGNGKEGFRLAEKPEESLAAGDKLGWTSAMAEHPQHAVMYLSEAMVGSVLPMMDRTLLWKRLSEAVRAPIRDERTIRQLLEQMAEYSARLAKRDAKALSIVFMEDRGYRLEARGGWLDPGLDYDKPLRMEGAAMAGNPVFRAHWVNNRVRSDAEWEQMELLGTIIEALVMDVADRYAEEEAAEITIHIRRGMDEVREFGRMYREEFRAGLGDEVAVTADVRGEIPPVPGISAKTIGEYTAPRLLVAVPMVDRSLVEKSGQSIHKQWRGLTAWGSEAAGMNLPLIAPQLIESGGIATWYPPAPFIGGDFIPGVSLNDELWMVSSSRSMVADFARTYGSSSKGGETGVVAELDVAPLRDWLVELYRRGEMDAKEAMGDSLSKFEPSEKSLDDIGAWFKKMETVRYRHWKEDNTARWSLRMKMAGQVK